MLAFSQREGCTRRLRWGPREPGNQGTYLLSWLPTGGQGTSANAADFLSQLFVVKGGLIKWKFVLFKWELFKISLPSSVKKVTSDIFQLNNFRSLWTVYLKTISFVTLLHLGWLPNKDNFLDLYKKMASWWGSNCLIRNFTLTVVLCFISYIAKDASHTRISPHQRCVQSESVPNTDHQTTKDALLTTYTLCRSPKMHPTTIKLCVRHFYGQQLSNIRLSISHCEPQKMHCWQRTHCADQQKCIQQQSNCASHTFSLSSCLISG